MVHHTIAMATASATAISRNTQPIRPLWAIGMASALDGKIALSRAVVQLEGEAMVCDSGAFRGAVLQSESLLAIVMRHEQALFAQAQQSTACMANHEVEARLCRWLLRARDLAGSDELPFTQEFLSDMLGVRRTSVTSVAHALQGAGIIRYSRGRIRIVDLQRLRDSACECYETVKAEAVRVSPKTHRAEADARHLAVLWHNILHGPPHPKDGR